MYLLYPPEADGDIVRWDDRGYAYAAIFMGGTWYLTGGASYYGTAKMTTAQLRKVLRRSNIAEVKIAALWDTVKITTD